MEDRVCSTGHFLGTLYLTLTDSQVVVLAMLLAVALCIVIPHHGLATLSS